MSVSPSRRIFEAREDLPTVYQLGATYIEMKVPAHPVAAELFEWWINTAFEDFIATVPKMLEYGGDPHQRPGSADLRIIGEGLMELLGWEINEETQAVAQELGCWFYTLGKGGRLISDYQQRRSGKPDTWFDKTIYSMMARRIQQVGRWP
jgi:hypothetical protein